MISIFYLLKYFENRIKNKICPEEFLYPLKGLEGLAKALFLEKDKVEYPEI